MSDRIFSEAEARGIATLMHLSTTFARVTIAGWNLRSSKPTKHELFNAASVLWDVEQAVVRIGLGPETDGHSVDPYIERLERRIEDEIRPRKRLG